MRFNFQKYKRQAELAVKDMFDFMELAPEYSERELAEVKSELIVPFLELLEFPITVSSIQKN